MNKKTSLLLLFAIFCPASSQVWTQEIKLLAEEHDYAPAMGQVAAHFKGQEGVVLHLGDSITYANPYSQWARSGRGKTPSESGSSSARRPMRRPTRRSR